MKEVRTEPTQDWVEHKVSREEIVWVVNDVHAWKYRDTICPVCGNKMFLVNGFHRCAECGFKESCCYL